MSACKVRGCRYRFSHTTAGHRCGTCGTYGHGQLECGDRSAIRNLRDAMLAVESVATPCTVHGCTHAWTHTSDAHHCVACGVRGACACAAAHVVRKACPTCRRVSDVDTRFVVHTGSECAVCMDSTPCVIFSGCRHANVCAACVQRLVDPSE